MALQTSHLLRRLAGFAPLENACPANIFHRSNDAHHSNLCLLCILVRRAMVGVYCKKKKISFLRAPNWLTPASNPSSHSRRIFCHLSCHHTSSISPLAWTAHRPVELDGLTVCWPWPSWLAVVVSRFLARDKYSANSLVMAHSALIIKSRTHGRSFAFSGSAAPP
jgi:hypothetical protein